MMYETQPAGKYSNQTTKIVAVLSLVFGYANT